MVICSIVAKETHRRYGMLMSATHGAVGYTTHSAQMSVPRTRKMSSVASIKLRQRNWMVVYAKLKMRLRINGSRIANGIACSA